MDSYRCDYAREIWVALWAWESRQNMILKKNLYLIVPSFYWCGFGFKGEKLLSACLKGYFGRHCSQACRCQNQKPCDHITGRCQCPRGYTGHSCTELCPQGSYGELCKQQCDCGSNAECDPISGRCFCKPGYTGANCSQGMQCLVLFSVAICLSLKASFKISVCSVSLSMHCLQKPM